LRQVRALGATDAMTVGFKFASGECHLHQKISAAAVTFFVATPLS
jgi:hypothetical protein